jgi:hypothetical protein
MIRIVGPWSLTLLEQLPLLSGKTRQAVCANAQQPLQMVTFDAWNRCDIFRSPVLLDRWYVRLDPTLTRRPHRHPSM